MTDETKEPVSVDLDIGGQKAKVSGANLTLLFAIAGAVAAGAGVYLISQHGIEAKAEVREVNVTLKEAVQSMIKAQNEANTIHRETNCLIGYQGPASEKVEFCKRISR